LSDIPHNAADLQRIYATRFAGKAEHRQQVWQILCRHFSRWIPPKASVLDLGCGYCEFINNVRASRKFAMDLNPEAQAFANPEVMVLQQNCAENWNLPPNSQDVVFTSNFFEHLPSKTDLEHTLEQAYRALVPGGKLIAMGPNIKYLQGRYWDFFDHYLPLTELSLCEVLKKCGFTIQVCRDRFLPYTMSDGREYPLWTLAIYLKLTAAWRFFGKQFLIVATKPCH
jgi:SAM-dependent methyltransferase